MTNPAFYIRKSRKAPRNGPEVLTSGADAAILTGKSENMALPFKYESIYIITTRVAWAVGFWLVRRRVQNKVASVLAFSVSPRPKEAGG